MKRREIRIWMAAAVLAFGMGLTACSADSVDTGVQNGAAEDSSAENRAEIDGSTAEAMEEESTSEADGGTKNGQDDADDAVLLEEGTVEDGTYEGIVVDASMNNFAIRTEEGVTYFMERPEEGSSLKDGLLLGIPVKVVIKDQAVAELTDGEKQPESGQETLNFVISVMDAFRYEDMEALTTLIKYPASVILEGDMVYQAEDAEQIEKIGAEKIFTEELKSTVRSVDLYEVKASEDGTYEIGQSEGGCRVVFEADEENDRGYSIRSIEGPRKTDTVG